MPPITPKEQLMLETLNRQYQAILEDSYFTFFLIFSMSFFSMMLMIYSLDTFKYSLG